MTREKAERRGRVAEWTAMLFLMPKGYRILGHRLRTPFGEVDLAASKAGVLVIVEVKARDSYDSGAYAVTPWRSSALRVQHKRSRAVGGWRPRRSTIDLVVVGSGLLPRHERGAWFDEARVG